MVKTTAGLTLIELAEKDELQLIFDARAEEEAEGEEAKKQKKRKKRPRRKKIKMLLQPARRSN